VAHHGEEALMSGLWGFVALAVVLSLTPGPDDVLVLNRALLGGARGGVAATLGVAAGSLLWGIAAATGLAAMVSHSPAMYGGLRWAGAGYLVALGAVPLISQALGPGMDRAAGRHAAPGRRRGGPQSAFGAGLVSDLLNPKIGVFYLMVLPQFVAAGAPVLQYSLVLCAIDVTVATGWLLGLTWLASTAVTWLRRPRVVTWSERLLNTALIGLGAAAAFGP
jgi:threonine/homoserine/homoserine lactone efflux protein